VTALKIALNIDIDPFLAQPGLRLDSTRCSNSPTGAMQSKVRWMATHGRPARRHPQVPTLVESSLRRGVGRIPVRVPSSAPYRVSNGPTCPIRVY
jgi:hypothetical protein